MGSLSSPQSQISGIKMNTGQNLNADAINTRDPWPNINQPKPLGLPTGFSASNGPSSGYVSSFYKQEMGSVDPKARLAPLTDPLPNLGSLKSGLHLGQSAFSSSSQSSPVISPRPPPALQPIHGRTDWLAKYRGRR
ncbi:serine/threonine-protein kinase ICK-like [Hyperolius riggenbachi]|uniref:serine/threonine-protein kinase ICK-like n=1 Tax=Hyperolius riggenbachi TaxID=752182 RepID=UPI0035A30E24